MRLVLLGISHHRAPIEVRERVAFDRGGAARVSAELAEDGFESVCLSTCNRTELYVGHPDARDAEERAAQVLAPVGEDGASLVYRLHDAEAALHLFRVAAGLDSLVPGEGEILGQVRAAYESGAPGPLLDRVFRQALYVGKKVRSETAIAESPASISAAAAALAHQVFGDLAARRVLLVGAGKVSELAARNLLSRGASIAFVANRSADRAAELAERLGAEPLALERTRTQLELADVVVSSTGAPGFVIERADVEAALPARRGRPLFVIDLAVPRDVDPAVNDLDGCFLYDIDDLQGVVTESLAGRRREAERAESIVGEEATRFAEWHASLEVVPAIASLRALAEDIRRAELAKAQARLGGLSDAERRAVDSMTAQIVNKLLHLPTVRMKQAAVTADGVLYADAVRHLFGLEDER
jgi:glutamyl-tRNA reductase